MAEVESGSSLTIESTVNVPAETPEYMPDDIPTLQAMLKGERLRNADLTKRVATSVPMILSYQPYIMGPPAPKEALWNQACSADKVTSNSWRDTWLNHIERNVKENDADAHMVDSHYGKFAYRPAIIAGSGPSLKRNIRELAKTPTEIPIVSCLHNFGYFIDNDIPCQYYLTLDAGQVVLPEMFEGGSERDKTKYQKASETRTLIAGLVTPPELIKQWKGEVVYFNATIPDDTYMEKMVALTKNPWVYSVGGNTLGACFYHAAYIFGCNPVAFVGADFAFDYTHKFHSWDSGYDAQFQGLVATTDVYGNRVYAWQSYQNFKCWFEFQALGGQSNHNLQMINCTEGGTLGAHNEGNIVQIKQLRLVDFLDGYTRWSKLGPALKDLPRGKYTVMC
jgi:hypothetical protein